MKKFTNFIVSLVIALTMFASGAIAGTTVSGDLTSVASSSSLNAHRGESIAYAVTGTFVGTWQLQRQMTGASGWESVATGTSTGSGTISVDNHRDVYRFTVTAYTSGTVSYSFNDDNLTIRQFKDVAGAVIITMDENGINCGPAGGGIIGSTNLSDCYRINGNAFLRPGKLVTLDAETETLTSAMCGSIFQIEVNTTTINLPATDPDPGCEYTFFLNSDTTVAIDPPAGTVIKCGDSVTADGATMTGTDDGDMMHLIVDQDDDYQCLGHSLITDWTFN